MPKFKYTARDKDGKMVTGIADYSDQDEIINALQVRGFTVVSVAVQKKKQLVEGFAARKLRRSLRLEDIALFCRQMATLLNAGVTLLRVLSILLREVDSKPLYEAIEKMRADIEGGRTLHDAMARHQNIFNAIWIALIETGEASGQLASSFDNLASYLEKSYAVSRKIKSAMIYPVILIVVCIIAILIFTLKIIPMFENIYKDLQITLPFLTVAVLSFSNFIQKYIIFFIFGLIVLIFAGKKLVETSSGRLMFDRIKLKLPLFGYLIRDMIMERFAHNLGTLVRSGVPILSALKVISRTSGNKVYENAIVIVEEQVRSGKAMSIPLEETGLFPTIVTQMVSVGEETGRLSEMFDRISVYYQERMNTAVERITAAFEPLLLIFLGITIGTLVVAMYLPIFKIATGGAIGL